MRLQTSAVYPRGRVLLFVRDVVCVFPHVLFHGSQSHDQVLLLHGPNFEVSLRYCLLPSVCLTRRDYGETAGHPACLATLCIRSCCTEASV